MEPANNSKPPLDEVVNTYYGKVYSYVLYELKDPNEAQDVTQNVFESVIQYYSSTNISDIQAWLHTIARNEVYHHRRRIQNNQQRFQDIEIDGIRSEDENPEQEYVKMRRVGLARIIREKENGRALTLFLQADGYTTEEIADMLHLPEGTVKSRMHYARLDLVGKYRFDYNHV